METILLIEDNIDILENLSEYLEIEGYKVFASNNGKKGIEIAEASVPNLIICDVLMPGMGGYEVFRLLSAIAKTSEIPFIFSTSRAEISDKKEAFKLGVDDYIIKPYELETLLKAAKTCLNSGSRGPK